MSTSSQFTHVIGQEIKTETNCSCYDGNCFAHITYAVVLFPEQYILPLATPSYFPIATQQQQYKQPDQGGNHKHKSKATSQSPIIPPTLLPLPGAGLFSLFQQTIISGGLLKETSSPKYVWCHVTVSTHTAYCQCKQSPCVWNYFTLSFWSIESSSERLYVDTPCPFKNKKKNPHSF